MCLQLEHVTIRKQHLLRWSSTVAPACNISSLNAVIVPFSCIHYHKQVPYIRSILANFSRTALCQSLAQHTRFCVYFTRDLYAMCVCVFVCVRPYVTCSSIFLGLAAVWHARESSRESYTVFRILPYTPRLISRVSCRHKAPAWH